MNLTSLVKYYIFSDFEDGEDNMTSTTTTTTDNFGYFIAFIEISLGPLFINISQISFFANTCAPNKYK